MFLLSMIDPLLLRTGKAERVMRQVLVLVMLQALVAIVVVILHNGLYNHLQTSSVISIITFITFLINSATLVL